MINAPTVGSHIAIFGHYWVTPNRYKAEFYWTEPSWVATNFYYPPSLTITNNDTTFRVKHELWNDDWMYQKPLEEQGLFTHVANVLPINDIRFAAKEACDSRLFLKDISAAMKQEALSEKGLPEYLQINKGDLRFRLHWANSHLNQCEVYDSEDSLLKAVDYEYDSNGLLQTQIVRLAEHNIPAGNQDKSPYKIVFNQQEYQFASLPVPYHAEDRLCRVEYKPVRLDDAVVVLPVSVIVYRGDMSRLLRRVSFYDYKFLSGENDSIFENTALAYPFDDNYTKCKQYIREKWRAGLKRSTYVFSPSESKTLLDIYHTFHQQFTDEKKLWERLKIAKMLCHTAIMLDKDEAALSWVGVYFDLLDQCTLDNMVIKSGLDLCRTLAIWRKADFLYKLVPVWGRHSVKYNNPKDIISFFHDSMIKQCWDDGRWYLYLFLNQVTSDPNLSLDASCDYELSLA